MHGRHGERASEGPAGLLAEYVGFSSCYVRAAVSWTGSLRPLRRADTTTAFVDFRLPELESLSELLALDVRIESEPDLELPYLIASFGSEAELRRYGSRSIMLKVAFVLWASAPTYAELHAALDGRTELVAPYRDERFAFYFSAHNATIAQDRKREIVDTFAYLSTGPDGLRGPIDLRNPQLEIGVFEYHAAGPARLHPDGVTLRRVFIGRKVRVWTGGAASSLLVSGHWRFVVQDVLMRRADIATDLHRPTRAHRHVQSQEAALHRQHVHVRRGEPAHGEPSSGRARPTDLRPLRGHGLDAAHRRALWRSCVRIGHRRADDAGQGGRIDLDGRGAVRRRRADRRLPDVRSQGALLDWSSGRLRPLRCCWRVDASCLPDSLLRWTSARRLRSHALARATAAARSYSFCCKLEHLIGSDLLAWCSSLSARAAGRLRDRAWLR